ncbi:MAG: response regulator [Desulfovibrionales bacterium]|nr:MAG: response regulator [Desulfovibrionales bacterium]
MQILIATNRSEKKFASFCDALQNGVENVELLFTNNWSNGLAAVKAMPTGFLILDQGLPEGEPFELIRQLLSVNPAVNCIVVTDLDKESFHEAGEGLGIFAQLPVEPSFADGEDLARRIQWFMEGYRA